MLNSKQSVLPGVFGCFFAASLCFAQPEQSLAPSLLPEENNPAVIVQEPVAAPALQGLPVDQPAPATSPDSVHAGKTQEQLLAELRDVYSPQKPSWWPLAPGWWLLGAVVFIAIMLMLHWLRKTLAIRRQQDWKKGARAEHQRLCKLADGKSVPSTEIIADASILMRRISLAQFPREKVASLTDQQWLSALDDLGNTNAYSQGAGKLLTRHPYMRPHDIEPAAVDELLNLVQSTIKNAPATLFQYSESTNRTGTFSMQQESGVV